MKLAWGRLLAVSVAASLCAPWAVAQVPARFADGDFDLELKFESELKIIRAHPIDVERPKNE